MKKLVCGVGINDSDYVVQIKETTGYKDNGKIIQKLTWICPFYLKWKGMLERCYSQRYQNIQPTYVGCSVVPEWHYFMTFRAWMGKQDWEGKELDKDILFPGNKIYSPDTCVFVNQELNKFINEREKSRGELLIGVSYHERDKRFEAWCRNNTINKYLGRYDTEDEAHTAWLTEKLRQAKLLAAEQTDPRVAEALIKRYENYTRI